MRSPSSKRNNNNYNNNNDDDDDDDFSGYCAIPTSPKEGETAVYG